MHNNDNIPQLICKNLIYYRHLSNHTQSRVAFYLNISRQAYSNYERGKREIRARELFRLALFYQISIDDLFRYPPENNKPLEDPLRPG